MPFASLLRSAADAAALADGVPTDASNTAYSYLPYHQQPMQQSFPVGPRGKGHTGERTTGGTWGK